MTSQSNQDFMAALGSLIDRWCEQRRLGHLAAVLPGFVGFNGLTDGWEELRTGLDNAVGLGSEALPDDEWQRLQRLSHDVGKALSSR